MFRYCERWTGDSTWNVTSVFAVTTLKSPDGIESPEPRFPYESSKVVGSTVKWYVVRLASNGGTQLADHVPRVESDNKSGTIDIMTPSVLLVILGFVELFAIVVAGEPSG